MKNKQLFRDILLIAALAAAALMLFSFGRVTSTAGQSVEVRINGELYAELSLSQDAVLDINGLCLLTISGGEARITEAVCRNQICVKHRAVSRTGEAIVCLPSGVTVKVVGGADGADFYI